jgi:DNA gyrase inhibitor GyrI
MNNNIKMSENGYIYFNKIIGGEYGVFVETKRERHEKKNWNQRFEQSQVNNGHCSYCYVKVRIRLLAKLKQFSAESTIE